MLNLKPTTIILTILSKKILINEEKYKDLVIYFTKNIHNKSMKILRLQYYKLIRKIESYEGKNYLMTDDYMLHNILDQIKKIIYIQKFDDAKILIKTDNRLPDDINSKNVVILITCIIRGDERFYPQIFLEEDY